MRTMEFCRQQSLAEPLYGTAAQVRRWIVLEDCSRWGPKPPVDSDLPEFAVAWLKRCAAADDARIQLVRRPGGARDSRRRLIIVDSAEIDEQRRAVELDVELDELPSIDPDALLARGGPTFAPLWLVCTHGTRDRCCAKWGMPLWRALHACDGGRGRVWQSSHIGGHRFAPTAVSLPHGIAWGRVELDRASELHAAVERGELALLDCLRGRSCHPPAVQAAECLLRRARRLSADGAVRLVDYREQGGHHHVRLSSPRGVESLVFVRRLGQLPTVGSCGDEPGPRPRFVVLEGPKDVLSLAGDGVPPQELGSRS